MLDKYFDKPTQTQRQRILAVQMALDIIKTPLSSTPEVKVKDLERILSLFSDNLFSLADSIQDAIENIRD